MLMPDCVADTMTCPIRSPRVCVLLLCPCCSLDLLAALSSRSGGRERCSSRSIRWARSFCVSYSPLVTRGDGLPCKTVGRLNRRLCSPSLGLGDAGALAKPFEASVGESGISANSSGRCMCSCQSAMLLGARVIWLTLGGGGPGRRPRALLGSSPLCWSRTLGSIRNDIGR